MNKRKFFSALKERDEETRNKLFGNKYEPFKCKKCGMLNGSRALNKCLYCGGKI